MTLSIQNVRARVPWEGTHGKPEIQQKEIAPRRNARYLCARAGCRFSPLSLPFAAGAEAPLTWDCRCGATARLEGAPDGIEGRPELPGLTSGTGRHARSHVSEGTTPFQQLMKNVRQREPGHAKAALAEALERARQARGAQ